jgi:hypothetical protein
VDYSSLRKYRDPSGAGTEDSHLDTDWGRFLSRLVIHGAVALFLGLLLFGLAIGLTQGQILRLFLYWIRP